MPRVTALILALPAAASPGGGPPPISQEKAITLEAANYAAEYGVGEDEAVRSLALMHGVSASHCNFPTARYNAPDGSVYDMQRRQWDMTESYDLSFFWDDHEPTAEFYPTSSATPRTLVG